MSLWGNNDADANTKPKFVAQDGNPTRDGANTYVGAAANTTVYGVDGAEIGVAGAGGQVTHTGWVKVTRGAGPVVSVTINNGGTGYANTDTVGFSAGGATGTITTDGAGVITAITITNKGSALDAVPTVNVTTGAGTGANLTAVLGGRFGRTFNEVLVAGSIVGDAADDTLFPDA